MFQLLTLRCRVCGGYTNNLLVGDRCLSCAYTPAGRPIGNGGWDAGVALPEPDWRSLFEEACGSTVTRPEDEDGVTPTP